MSGKGLRRLTAGGAGPWLEQVCQTIWDVCPTSWHTCADPLVPKLLLSGTLRHTSTSNPAEKNDDRGDRDKDMSRILRWMGLVVVAAVALAVGCSGQTGPVADRAAGDGPATTSADQSNNANGPGENTVPSRVLAGMYRWDPHGGFHDAAWSGTLAVEAPCLYVDAADSGEALGAPRDEPLRSFVRLPEPLTRYDAGTGLVWVDGYGPMTTGDDVVLTGSEGWQAQWNVNEPSGTHEFEYDWERGRGCPAHVSFYATSMMPRAAADAGASSNSPTAAHLAGLYPWDREQLHTDIAVDATLIVEPPCLYAQFGSSPSRYFLRLPRPLVRFDPESDSVWVGDHGPMTTGNSVSLQGGPAESEHRGEFYEGGCSARGYHISTWMVPRNR